MKIQIEALKQYLSPVKPIYLLSSDEYLLIEESRHRIITAAKQQGYSEVVRLTVQSGFSWDNFYQAVDHVSLFSEKKIINLRFHQKPSNDAKNALAYYMERAEQLVDTHVLLLEFPYFDAATQKTAWFKQIESNSIFVPIWPVSAEQFPQWLQIRLRSANIHVSSQGMQKLVEATTGNLLAAAQVIEKLKLMTNDASISDALLAEVLSDQSDYDVFELSDACLQRNLKKALFNLNNVKQKGIEPSVVLWVLHKELTALLQLAESYKFKKDMKIAFSALKIWPRKQNLYLNYLRQPTKITLVNGFKLAHMADKQIKGMAKGSPWVTLTSLCALLCGVDDMKSFAS